MREAFPTTLYSIADGAQTITHNLGRAPKWMNVWAVSQANTYTNFQTGTRVLVSGTGYYNARDIIIQWDTLTTTQATVRLEVAGSTVQIIDLGGVVRTINYSDVRFRYQFFG